MPKKATKQVQTPQPDWLWRYRVTILRILDGDTVEIQFDQGLGNTSTQTCRLYGINTPELRKDGGRDALEALADMGGYRAVWARTIKNRSESKAVREKYGRYLVELYLTSLDMDAGFPASINQKMIDDGFAKPYFGIGPKV